MTVLSSRSKIKDKSKVSLKPRLCFFIYFLLVDKVIHNWYYLYSSKIASTFSNTE